MRTQLRLSAIVLLLAPGADFGWGGESGRNADDPAVEFVNRIRPVIAKHCFSCHSSRKKKSGLDLERYGTLEDVRRDIEPWQAVLEMLASGEMPPEGKPRPKADDLRFATTWLGALFDREAELRAGDPGPVPIRRLNNAEYTHTIRDLTGVSLDPTRHFPSDSAAGEGFLNATAALSLSPDLLSKYLDAAKEVAAHAVLLPDGVRFSKSTFREDWVNEVLREIRRIQARYGSSDGEPPMDAYLKAAHSKEPAPTSLSPRYVEILRESMAKKEPSLFLDALRSKWKTAAPKDLPGIARDIEALKGLLWKRRKAHNEHVLSDRLLPAETPAAEQHRFALKMPKTKAGEFIAVYFVSRRVRGEAKLLIGNPRFEAGKSKALPLREVLAKAAKDAPPPPGGVRRLAAVPEGKEDLVLSAGETVEIRLPGALVSERTFVVDVSLVPGANPGDVVQVDLRREPRFGMVPVGVRWQDRAGGSHPPLLVGRADEAVRKEIVRSADEFRRLFPARLFYPGVIVRDTEVTLERFHRGDEALSRLFLSEDEKARFDRLWDELAFISREALQVRASLATLVQGEMGGVKKVLPEVHRRAEEMENRLLASEPSHLAFLAGFAERAYRGTLGDSERKGLEELYRSLRNEKIPHDEAFRAGVARVLMSARFLYRLETIPEGAEPQSVSDRELATRLSYFLWSSMPDPELRDAAESGKLRDSKELARQVRRMLAHPRSRALAVEFGTQWVEVRGFDRFQGKNPELFPIFDESLRKAMYEESILFFQDFFRSDGSVQDLLDGDHAYLNETLARHYGIPGVTGEAFRRVKGVGKYDRGGMLVQGSLLAKHSGASRTSPVLRGVFISEILLGEKLPRPPDDVPELPEGESEGELTVRQLVEKHASAPACAVCHKKIDPLGFALEEFDTIGRRREKDLAGRPVDAVASLAGGATLRGIEGLKKYLLSDRKAEFDRQFCRKLLGYALGRRVLLSDRKLLDEMVAALEKTDGRISAAVLTLVGSRQFRFIRGSQGVR